MTRDYYKAGGRKYYKVGSDCVLYHAYWDGTTKDHSKYGNDGINGGGTFVENGIYLAGDDDRIWVENNAQMDFGTSDFTFLMWVKTPAGGWGADKYLILFQSGAGLWVPSIAANDNVVSYTLYNDAWSGKYTQGTPALTRGVWTQIGWVVDRDVGGYGVKNGVFTAAAGNLDAESSVTTGRMGIGNYPPTQQHSWLSTYIGEMLMFNVAKSEVECAEHFNATSPRYA